MYLWAEVCDAKIYDAGINDAIIYDAYIFDVCVHGVCTYDLCIYNAYMSVMHQTPRIALSVGPSVRPSVTKFAASYTHAPYTHAVYKDRGSQMYASYTNASSTYA